MSSTRRYAPASNYDLNKDQSRGLRTHRYRFCPGISAASELANIWPRDWPRLDCESHATALDRNETGALLVALRDVQEAASHADPRTTSRQSGPGPPWTGTPPTSSPPTLPAPPGNGTRAFAWPPSAARRTAPYWRARTWAELTECALQRCSRTAVLHALGHKSAVGRW
jgi:hypothetical protein